MITTKGLLSLLFLAVLLTAFDSIQLYQSKEPKKLALVIAISKYDKDATGWSSISAENDIPLISGALMKLGFSSKNISVLKDELATRSGITQAIKDLENKTNPGDMVVIHVSSHGQQILDDNNDEIDGLDEAIVPYGAPASQKVYESSARGSKVQYDGSLHLRDEVFGELINGVRGKAGKNGHVLVIMDNCHSGTGTRGSAKVRGGEPPFVPKNWTPGANMKKEDSDGGLGFYAEAPKSRGNDSNLAKFVVISGATAHELNYETKDDNDRDVGSLTYSISKVLQSLPKGTTYRQLFAHVQSEMAKKAPKQNPQVEGDIDFEIFGGKYVAQEKYFSINKLDSKEIIINAGRLNGIAEGTTVSVENKGATGPSKDGTSLAKGKVTRVTNFEATIELDKSLAIKDKIDGWVFVTSEYIPERKVRVDLSPIKDKELKAALEKSIKELAMAELVTTNSDLTIRPPEDMSRGAFAMEVFSTAYNSPLLDKPITGSDYTQAAELCKNLIHNYSQGQFFKELNLTSPDYEVMITRFIPIKAGSRNLSDSLDYKTLLNTGGAVIVPEGTRLFIEVKNYGNRVAYFNIMDIEPSGKINPLLPSIDSRSGIANPPPVELKLLPGEKRILNNPISIGPPYGKELFKVIATGVPFDLSSTINTKGESVMTRGANQPKAIAIERLLGKSYDGSVSTRGAAQEEGEMGTHASEFGFNITRR